MYNYETEQFPMASPEELAGMCFIGSDEVIALNEPWGQPLPAPLMETGNYFDDAMEPVELVAYELAA